jgi:hypothetical protein
MPTEPTPASERSRLVDLLEVCGLARPSAPAKTAVLWVFRDANDGWCVRLEGGGIDLDLGDRGRAVAFAQALGKAWGSYHLYLELHSGRFAQEYFNLDRTDRSASRAAPSRVRQPKSR